MSRAIARALGGVGLAAAAFVLLSPASRWVAVPFALATACFAVWRSMAGALAGFAFMLAAGWLALRGASAESLRALAPIATTIGAVLLFGVTTIVTTTAISAHGWPSRRFLGAWLAATGVLLVGLALAAAPAAAAMGSVLVAGGLAGLLGAVPWFAWAPLLLRHQRPSISMVGSIALLLTGAVAWWALPRLPDPDAARTTVAVLGGVVVPWAAWMAWRQRAVDPRCARSYAAVVAGGLLLIVRASV